MDNVAKNIKTFSALEKSANLWSGKARGKTIASVDAPADVASQAQEEEALKQRRHAFLRRAEKTEEEQKIRKEKQRLAAAAVRKALKTKESEHIAARPLRRFDCKLLIIVVVHAYNPKTKRETLKRIMAVMEDKLKYDKLMPWLSQVTGVDPKKNLSLEWVSHRGTMHPISDRQMYQSWLDSMWMCHPPLLHVYDHEYLMEQSLDRSQDIRDIFDEYDTDKSGEISQAEMTSMIVEMDLAGLGVSQDDIASFVTEEFERVDKDGSGNIDFDEFVVYYNTLKDYLKDKLTTESKHTHTLIKFREELSEAKSIEMQIGELIAHKSDVAKQGLLGSQVTLNAASENGALWKGGEPTFLAPAHRFSPAARAVDGGVLLLDALDHDYSIEVILPANALKPAVHHNKWIRAETVIPQQVDYFTDGTGELGLLCSPTVSVEFEDGLDRELIQPYTIVLPHCFAAGVGEKWRGVGYTCGDIVVCYSTWAQAEWLEIDHTHWEWLEEPLANSTYNCKFGAIAVSMVDAGLVCAFLRNDRLAPPMSNKPKTRVRAVAYLPLLMSVLEIHVLRIYLVQNLPDEIEQLKVAEQKERGTVVMAGQSHVFDIEQGKEVVISMGGLLVEAQTDTVMWTGETTFVEFDFDPDDLADVLREQRKEKGGQEDDDGELHGNLHIGLQLQPSAKAAYLRKARGEKVPQGEQHHFYADVNIHNFPPPGPPPVLQQHARTQTSLTVEWLAPTNWGGCALDCYELEYREKNNKDEYSTEWTLACTVGARKTQGTIHANIYKCDVRVRARNVGTRDPGEWSEVLVLDTDKVETSKFAASKEKGLGKSMKTLNKEAAEETAAKKVAEHSSTEQGMVVVVQTDLATLLNTRHTLADAKYDGVKIMEDNEWSDFQQAIGSFFVTAGVYGGVFGQLFDLTPQLVEELAANDCGGPSKVIDEDKPLLSLAVSACWVLQTLAHHSEKPEEWIPFCNDIASLVRLAADAPEEPSSEPLVVSLLYAMIDVYETLRQCEPSGYVSQQLGYKYDKTLKKMLKADWEEQKERMRNAVSTHVMGLVLYDRFKKHGLRKLMNDASSKRTSVVRDDRRRSTMKAPSAPPPPPDGG